jgi:aryl-alcohol dehydrogenase-like predicted oxidoreductase
MSLSDYVTLGNSGLRVSPMCLGGMTFGGEQGWGSSPPVSQEILNRYIERGGNFIDTANVYGRSGGPGTAGRSEAILGEYIGREPALRHRLVIATKFGASMRCGDPNSGGAGRKAIYAACEASLQRLQTDYIDLYWMHFWDKFSPIEETLRALDDLVGSGRVRYVGFSDCPAWKVAQAAVLAGCSGLSRPIAIQIEYNLLERSVESELTPMARELGLGVVPYAPLKSGTLSGKYTRANAAQASPDRGILVTRNFTERTFRIIESLAEMAVQLSTTIPRVALAWLRQRPAVNSIIIGARTPEQLEDNLSALELELTPQQIRRLDEESRPVLSWPAGFLATAGTLAYSGTTINSECFPSTNGGVRPLPNARLE